MSLAGTVSKLAPVQVFDMAEANRVSYMKSLGARNLNPPLPRSPFLRNKVTGRIMPWNELLSEQTELMECCDAEGNTDPAAWSGLVPKETMTEAEMEAIVARKQSQLLATASAHGGTASVRPTLPSMPDATPLPTGVKYGDDMTYEDLQSMRSKLADLAAELGA